MPFPLCPDSNYENCRNLNLLGLLLLGLSTICLAEKAFECTAPPNNEPNTCVIVDVDVSEEHVVTAIKKNPETQDTKEVRFEKSKITHAPTGIFKLLPTLETLKMENLTMAHFNGKVFEGAASLKVFSAMMNLIEEIPDKTFDEATKLEILQLSQNSIRKLGNEIFAKLTNLTELHLAENKLEKVTKEHLKENKKLQKISFANNKQLKISESTFDDLKEITEIDLSGNDCGGAKFTITKGNFSELNAKLADKVCSSAIKISITMLSVVLSILLSLRNF